MTPEFAEHYGLREELPPRLADAQVLGAEELTHLSLMGSSLCGADEGELTTEHAEVTCPHCMLLIEVDQRRHHAG